MKKALFAFLRLLPGLTLLLLAASCSETPKRFINKNQASLNNTLDHLAAVGAKASDQTLSAETLALPANAPVLDLDDIGNYGYEGRSNAQLFTTRDLLDPDATSPGMHLFPSRMVWQTVKAMVKDGKFTEPEQNALQALKRLSGWRYAVVIRPRSVRAPEIRSITGGMVTDTAAYSTATYAGGAIEGDVLVYDLDDLSFLGGFLFSAQSSSNVESTTYGAGDANKDLQHQLDRDIIEQIKKAAFFGMIDRLPGDRVYMNGNLRQRVMTEKGR